MQITQPIYIGTPITIKSLRDYILDASLTEKDTIVLHYTDFREIIIEYRRTFFSQDFPAPYLLLGILVKEDSQGLTGIERIVVIYNDTQSIRVPQKATRQEATPGLIFRCGWCGNIVDFDGSQLTDFEYLKREDRLKKRDGTITVRNVNGYCCPDRDQPIATSSL